MDKTIQLQTQIRQNAEEVSTYLQDMLRWEKEIEGKDRALADKRKHQPPMRSMSASSSSSSSSPRREVGTVYSAIEEVVSDRDSNSATKAHSAARHTYDVGYKQWDSLDYDAMLSKEEIETGDEGKIKTEVLSEREQGETVQSQTGSSTLTLTPVTILQTERIEHVPASAVPRPLRNISSGDTELAERERGNQAFKSGDFQLAAKLYTKCIGIKVRNYVAFSNRAMAYLKMKEYARAEIDTNCALSM
jgi:tetratricopeptide (TPR) repeat protein